MLKRMYMDHVARLTDWQLEQLKARLLAEGGEEAAVRLRWIAEVEQAKAMERLYA